MTRTTIKRWMGACLFGSALVFGCSQFRTGVSDSAPMTAHPVVRPPLDRTAIAQPAMAFPQPQPANLGPWPPTLPPVAPTAANRVKQTPIAQAGFDSRKPGLVDQPGAAPKAAVDTAAHPGFSHSADYTELTGQIQHSLITKGWRLRYAAVDEVDPYGGSVTLLEDPRLSTVKDGDLVHVHGRLLNHVDRAIAPPYEVDSVEPIDKKP
jgi:hypothetical protein